MDGHRCKKCGAWWTSQAGSDRFTFITYFCPNCLPVVSTARLDPSGPELRPPVDITERRAG